MAPRTTRSSEAEMETDLVSESDIKAWAERERERRRLWLEGPNEEEKQEWARSERRRRRRAAFEPKDDYDEDEIEEGRRLADRWERDVALALAGVASRLVDSPYRLLGNLVREGREWEDKHRGPRRRRPRVWMEDEE
jgi:hypothetical protein